MLTPRQARFAFLPLMLIAMSALIGLAAVVFRQGLEAGPAEAWMMAWVLAFTIALPAAMLVLPILSAVLKRVTHPATVPHVGVTVPRLGQ
ncbi:DUF2798 domain-containing protein [Lysobacter niastensis]|uniref:DUF2798 domain-containing protein n=1 Tax=Lysobacter niastensis TaxID=380629 RepID=A0ABS0B6A1_9GAMM|nr:DUF2798 domain-containing protein [Lysobacter niastensis]MBF6023197.1 DUF2798 domain-containing protein [Lysobacter niastensis]